MSILAIRFDPTATDVEVTKTVLRVSLSDGRELAAPIEWFPRLRDASVAARRNWKLIGKGAGIHWPDVDEDISVAGLMTDKMQHAPPESVSNKAAAKKLSRRAAKIKLARKVSKNVSKIAETGKTAKRKVGARYRKA